LFNRKSTAFQQDLEKLERRIEACERTVDKQTSDNKRDLLEFADLSSKLRRLYLRLTRIAKIEQEPTSTEIEDNGQKVPDTTDARAIREAIERQIQV